MKVARNIIHLNEVNSTNQYLEELITTHPDTPEHTIINTDNQTLGKGQGENKWHSSPSQNLSFSYLLRPEFLKPSHQFRLNIMVSLAIVNFLSKYYPQRAKIKIKWPNDIYIGDKKIAGILIRLFVQNQKIENAILGIGININEKSFPEELPNPVSLSQETKIDYDLSIMLEQVSFFVHKGYQELQDSHWKSLKESYLNSLYRYNLFSKYIYKEETIIAKITDITRYGQLQLTLQNEKEIICNMQEIKYLL